MKISRVAVAVLVLGAAAAVLGFGQGHHYCIGTHVARLEGRVLLEELLARAPGYEIDTSGLETTPSEFQVGFVEMPLIVG